MTGNNRPHWHRIRIRAVLYALLCCFGVSYLWILGTVFEPTSIAINLQHLKDLRYLLNSARCAAADSSKEVVVLILVGSHPTHVGVRRVLRKAWGDPGIANYRFKLVFLFGMLATDSQNKQMTIESEQYGDIVQGDFQDSYYNVTLRDLMGFQWAWRFCRDAKYILRADDDIALDVYRLMDILKERFSEPTTIVDSIGCYEIVERAVPRRYGRYAVAAQDYDGHHYADYCNGWLYVLTPSVAKRLVDRSLSTRPLWINDVYITGTLAKSLGLRLRNIGLKFSVEYKDMHDFVVGKGSDGTRSLEMGPTRADANFTETVQEIYRRNAMASGLLTVQ